jgi:hypothetical protein
MSFIGFISVVAIIALLVVTLIFFVPPFSNNNDAPLVNRWILSGRYEDPRGASIEFINGTHAIMGTRIYGSGFEPDENSRHGNVITITGQGFEPDENMPMTAFSYSTYTFDGNQITFYREASQGSGEETVLVGYATVSANAQEIVFYGDVYTKN